LSKSNFEEMKIVNLKEVPHHLDTLSRWYHEEWSYLKPKKTLADRIERMKSHLLPEFVPTTFVATNHALFGSAAIIEHDMDTRKELTPWLAGVYVAPEFRRQGIGSKLVLHIMEQAKQNMIKRLYLFTPDRDAFYTRLGWKIFEKTSYLGYAVTIMYMDL
jgi:N-acetylglutamate synthase-like GNAT family acetyltransferase